MAYLYFVHEVGVPLTYDMLYGLRYALYNVASAALHSLDSNVNLPTTG